MIPLSLIKSWTPNRTQSAPVRLLLPHLLAQKRSPESASDPSTTPFGKRFQPLLGTRFALPVGLEPISRGGVSMRASPRFADQDASGALVRVASWYSHAPTLLWSTFGIPLSYLCS
jgi:hypothetical protein